MTGGVSGLSGSFIGLSYQTNNFLGLGETLTLSGQIGTIQRTVLFGFTEPYLFDRPISTGFTVSSSHFAFDLAQQASLLLGQKVQIAQNIEQDYNNNTTGGTIFASYPLRRFSFMRLGLTYGYSDTSIQSFSTSSTALFEALHFRPWPGFSALSGIQPSQISRPRCPITPLTIPWTPRPGSPSFIRSTLRAVRSAET